MLPAVGVVPREAADVGGGSERKELFGLGEVVGATDGADAVGGEIFDSIVDCYREHLVVWVYLIPVIITQEPKRIRVSHRILNRELP